MSRTNHKLYKTTNKERATHPYRRINKRVMLKEFEEQYIRKNADPIIEL